MWYSALLFLRYGISTRQESGFAVCILRRSPDDLQKKWSTPIRAISAEQKFGKSKIPFMNIGGESFMWTGTFDSFVTVGVVSVIHDGQLILRWKFETVACSK